MEDVDPVADFAKRYYSVVNDTPSLVHSMYHPSARFCWPTANGLELELKTAMTVKRFFGKHTDIKLKAQSTIRLPLNNDILLVVRGITLGAQNPGFVQVLHLTESNGQFLVKDDVLSVTAGGTGSDESTGEAKLTQALVVGRTDSLEATQEAKLPSFSKSGIEQDITKKSRFGRKLKPSQHTASINELLSKPEYAPVVAVSPAVLVAPVIECPKEESTVLIQYDERMLKHVEVTVPGVQRCREVPGRIKRIMKQFKSDGLYERCDIQTTSEMATFAQLELMHEPGYVQFISKLPSMSDEERLKYVDTSVYFSQGDGTRIASFIAVGSVIKVCDSVGLNAHKKAFAVVRPPGHHAMKSKADGFCLFNNVAIGAAYMIQKYSLEKLLVLDIDVHHGNGTQSMFYNTSSVLFISIHSSELTYPSGEDRSISYVGEGEGEGFNVNIPLEGTYGDSDMMAVFNQIVLPIAKEFDPDVTFISAGYDAAKGDPMAYCKVSEEGYATMAAKTCSVGTGRVIMVLEGGYNQKVTGCCASHSVRGLLGDSDVLLDEQSMKPPLLTTMKTISDVKAAHNNYWMVLAEEEAERKQQALSHKQK